MRQWVTLAVCGIAGCQAPRIAMQEPPPTPIIRLCQHDVPADVTAITQEVQQIVTPGMPIEAARARLEAEGFRVFGSVPKKYRKNAGRMANRASFEASCDEIGAWGRRYFSFRAVVNLDENMNVSEVEVPRVHLRQRVAPFASYFSHRPNLREPVGLTLSEARHMMESEGFRCTPVDADRRDKGGQPYLYCRAVAETPLGGNIIRVRLFHDDSGRVTDARLSYEAEAFDELLCMLPDVGDSPPYAIVKTIVFPARLYTALVVGGLGASIAISRP